MSKYYSSSIAFGAKQTKTEKVVVSPTKIGDVTTDAVSGALTVDEVPVLNSLNPVSSDGVARAVIQAGAELPTRGSSDTGKVLTVANSDGDLEWDKPVEELPDMDGQSGKLLGAVDNNGTMEAQWVNPPEELPSVANNAGKVLTVNAGATGVEWAAQTAYTAGVGIDITAEVVSADIDGVTIKQASMQSTLQSETSLLPSPSVGYGVVQLNSDVTSKIGNNPSFIGKTITIHIPGNTFRRASDGDFTSIRNVYLELNRNNYEFGDDRATSMYSTPLATEYNSTEGFTYLSEQDVVVSCDIHDWANFASLDPASVSGRYYVGFGEAVTVSPSNQLYVTANGSDSIASPVVISETVTSNKIAVANPVPSYDTTTDVGKVLQVQNDGTLAWVTLS